MSVKQVIALDVGGSSVKSGIVNATHQVTGHRTTPIDSQGSADHIIGTLADIIQSYMRRIATDDLLGVGFGFPSPFDYPAGVSLIRGVKKYEQIYNLNIRSALQERLNTLNLLINFRNDAEAALIGESTYGAGRAYTRLIGVTLGTGLGSAFIASNERVVSGPSIPEPDGMLFHETYQGIWSDELFSTRGLMARVQQAALPFTTVARTSWAATEGDPRAQQVFHEFGEDLGRFLQPYIVSFNAEALLVLGGIAKAMQHFEQGLMAQIPVPALAGELGQDSALLGAAQPLLGRDLA